MIAGDAILFACHDDGRRHAHKRRAMASTVSPGATVTAPLAAIPAPVGIWGGFYGTTDRAASGAPARVLPRAWVGPCNTALLLPADAPAVSRQTAQVCGASGRLSTRLAGAPCAIEPVASGMLADEERALVENRDASPLQAATLIAVSASASDLAGQHPRAQHLENAGHRHLPARTTKRLSLTTLRVNKALSVDGASTLPIQEQNHYNSRAFFPGKSGTKRTPIRPSCL